MIHALKNIVQQALKWATDQSPNSAPPRCTLGKRKYAILSLERLGFTVAFRDDDMDAILITSDGAISPPYRIQWCSYTSMYVAAVYWRYIHSEYHCRQLMYAIHHEIATQRMAHRTLRAYDLREDIDHD